jgi:hypothetical protein
VLYQGEPDGVRAQALSNPPPADFGPWQRVDFIDDKPGQDPRKAGDGDNYEVRYRSNGRMIANIAR